MNLIVTMPFHWDGKHYAVGERITDKVIIDGMRNGKEIPNPKVKKGKVVIKPAPTNHYVAISSN